MIWAAPDGSRSGWVEIDLGEEMDVTKALLDDMPYSRTRKFSIQAKVGDGWKTLTSGTTIGAQKTIFFDKVKARVFRLEIQEAVDVPTIAEFQLFGNISQPSWGKLLPVDGADGCYSAELPQGAAARNLQLPTPFPNIVRARIGETAAKIEFNADASQIALLIPPNIGGELRLEIAEDSVRRNDGRVVFSAKDAKVVGTKAAGIVTTRCPSAKFCSPNRGLGC